MLFKSLLFSSLLLKHALASALPEAKLTLLEERDALNNCVNGPTNRGCWSNGYSINTDAETSWPNTGKTVSYTLTVTQQNHSADGYVKNSRLINGQYPGPTLTANWGDTLQITVVNQMTDNGTSFHWHGISQKSSCTSDGVNGITECPIAPGQSKTYKFIANEHGTTWYHSHYTAQYVDGVVGTIVINGPASANYDIDLGPLPVQDYFYQSMYDALQSAGTQGPPTANNALINGKNMNAAGTAGQFSVTTLTPGKKHRLRLINVSVDAGWYVSLDNHTFQVIESDFVPIKPYNTTWLFIGIGQRYDVIINANAKPGNYWFRMRNADGCGTNANTNIRSIFNYAGSTLANPTTAAATQPLTACADETQLVPYVAKAVDKSQFSYTPSDTMGVNIVFPTAASPLVSWTVNNSTINVDWENPTLLYVEEKNTSYPSNLNIYQLPQANQNEFAVTHPIHLHGHDFYVLGEGTTQFTSADTSSLNFVNPPRRDVAMLQASGYLVLAFQTDNPGAWLMHCHIAWHVSEGLAVQFLERVGDIPSTMDLSVLNQNCANWDKYYATAKYKKDDSGL